MKRSKIYFAYVKPLSFSGQSAASEMLIGGLSARGWQCIRIPIYPLDRSIQNKVIQALQFGWRIIRTWLGLFLLIFKSSAILHLNLGQSLESFIRVSLPFICLKILRRDLSVITSLHGSVFMQWGRSSLVAKIFLWYLRQSHAVTVLGDQQRQKLIELGIEPDVIHVVPNTCELEIEADEEVQSKQLGQKTVRLLHLSLLIESKGYPEYLDALEILSKGPELPCDIEAVLCGPMSFTAYCQRFTNEPIKEKWIHSKIDGINSRSSGVNVKWIRGAKGEEKAKLFRDAQIFVFPSQFPVEAQPLVLLEAMASGCALITSMVGEIPSTVNTSAAILESNPSAENIAEHIKQLLRDPERRIELGLGGVRSMREKYTVDSHLDHWEQLLGKVI